MYCTYLTVYSGNKLPPFYIGYSTIDKVLNKNYHGTVSSVMYKEIWNKELIENPHAFKTIILTNHNIMIEAKLKETKILTYFDAKNNPLYINKSNSDGLFCNSKVSESTKKKISKARTGVKHTTETKKKIGFKSSLKRFSIEQRKRVSASLIGNTRRKDNPHTEETKKHLSQIFKEKQKIQIQCPHCLKIGGTIGMKRHHFNNCSSLSEKIF